jgi:tubulin polyglutamylase complex subunit 2
MNALIEQLRVTVVDFLDAHPGISRFNFEQRIGASEERILQWERAHAPEKLPDDLKAFVRLTDGLDLRWDLWHHGSHNALGQMHVNSLAELKPLPESVIRVPEPSMTDGLQESVAVLPAELTARELRAYDLDSSCSCGRVALFLGRTQPQVGHTQYSHIA